MAAQNEAKVRFSADTKGFNDEIRAANKELTGLRSEMKLNEAQMKANGVSVEGLQVKQENLTAQMETAQKKTKALSDKLAVAVEIFGENSDEAAKLKNQLLQAQTAEVNLQRALNTCNAELERQEEAANHVETASESLSGEIADQRKEVDKLKSAYVDAVLEFGEGSDKAKALADQIDDLSGELKDNKKRMEDASRAADELDQSLDDAEDRDGEGFTVLKGAMADLVSEGIQRVIGSVGEMMSYLSGLPAETMELRQDFGTLTTAFDNVGLGAETATSTWKELYKVFGEDDRAVETANNIARIADNEQDLNKWITITTGIWGTYQDSLPVEGLAEAAAETAKVGTVTGGLADALNWSSEAATMFADYMSEDVVTAEDAFNVALSECSTEAERQALITDTLTKLYGGAADTYRDTTSAQMEAKEATAETILAEANLASVIEPVTTEWTNMKNELLVGLLPVVEDVVGWLKDTMVWLQEHPVALKILAGVLGVVAAALATLTIVTTAQTIAQWALNSAILANPLTWIIVGIVAAIAAVVAIIVVMIEYWDQIVEAVKNACASVVSALQAAWDWFVGLFSTIGTWIYDNVIAPVVAAFQSVVDWVKTNWQAILLFLINPLAGVFKYLYDNFEGFRNFVNNIVSSIAGFFKNLWDGFINGAKKAWEGVKSVFSAVGGFFSNVFGIVKDKIVSVFQAGGKVFNNIKDGIVNVFKTVVNGIIKGINNVIKLPFQGLNKILDKIHGVSVAGVKPFSWLTWRAPIPKIPLLAEGGILTQPTLNIAGEAGPEAIIPIDKLQSYIGSAIDRTMQSVNIQALVAAVEDLASRPIELSVNGRQFAVATANDTDAVNGNRLVLSKRGLAL